MKPKRPSDLTEEAAARLLSLIPLYHTTVLQQKTGISGLRAAQFRVLHLLMHHGIQQMSGIGRKLYISKPYMTALIEGMAEEGLVERQPDPEDRRVILIHITAKGRSHLAIKAALIRDQLRRQLSALTPKDLELLCDSVQDLSQVLEKIREA